MSMEMKQPNVLLGLGVLESTWSSGRQVWNNQSVWRGRSRELCEEENQNSQPLRECVDTEMTVV